MKKLLYFAAFAVMFTSCSVDSLQDENSIDLDVYDTRATESVAMCKSTNLVNDKGGIEGTLESYINYANNRLTLKFTAYNSKKIKASKVFLGPCDEVSPTDPGLFQSGKYIYSESFKNGVYIANYDFKLSSVQSDFCIRAVLNLSNDNGVDTVCTDASGFDSSTDGLYIQGFFENCMK